MPGSTRPGKSEDDPHLDVGGAVESWTDNIYRIIRLIGRGGSSNTYLAICSTGKRKGLNFAVKAFRRISKPERLTSFMREINFLRGCDHPAVMRVFDEGIYLERYPFVVVEYLPETLHDLARKRTGFLKKLSYSLHLLSALDYLQRLDPPVVHRDIKPRNAFVRGEACILGDFGLMKHGPVHDDEDREVVRQSYGPRMPQLYRTPDLVEYLKGGPSPTTSSDVFQLGLVLAGLFTGRNPEKPMGRGGFLSEIELIPLGDLDHRLWSPVKRALEEMLDLKPASRPTPEVLTRRFLDLYLDEVKKSKDRRDRRRRP